MKRPTVSIIITTWNGKSFIERCLVSIKAHTRIPHEVIVVDNGSRDGSLEVLRSNSGIRLIENSKNLGAVVAANQELSVAKGKYIVHLDNDVVVSAGWLEGLVSAAEGYKSVGLVGSKLLYPNGKIMHAGGFITPHWCFMYGNKESDDGRYDTPRLVDWVSSACILIKRDVFEKIGFFDEGFSPIYFEETDYCARAKKAGFGVLYTPDCKVYHVDSGSTKKQESTRFRSDFIFYLGHRNRVRFILLNFPVGWILRRVPREIGFFAKHTFKGKLKWLLKGYMDNIIRLPEILRKRFNRTGFVGSIVIDSY